MRYRYITVLKGLLILKYTYTVKAFFVIFHAALTYTNRTPDKSLLLQSSSQ